MTRDPMFDKLPKNELNLDPAIRSEMEKMPKPAKPKKEPAVRDPMFDKLPKYGDDLKIKR